MAKKDDVVAASVTPAAVEKSTILEVVQPIGTPLKDGLAKLPCNVVATTTLYTVYMADLTAMSSDDLTALTNELMQLRGADFIFQIQETNIFG